MAGFDKERFAEALGAAVFGAFIYDKITIQSFLTSECNEDDLRKFQSSLVLSGHRSYATESEIVNYLKRVSSLSGRNKSRYIRSVIQPSPEHFDVNLTALVIGRHATASDEFWLALVDALSLSGEGVVDKIKRFDRQLEAKFNRETEERVVKILDRDKSIFGRVVNLFSWAITFDTRPEVWAEVKKKRRGAV